MGGGFRGGAGRSDSGRNPGVRDQDGLSLGEVWERVGLEKRKHHLLGKACSVNNSSQFNTRGNNPSKLSMDSIRVFVEFLDWCVLA